MKTKQGGFALIAAIVLVVFLAALTGFVASMTGGQAAGTQLERTAQGVDFASQTGLEWGAYRVLRTTPANCAATTALPALPAYPGVTVTVACTQTATDEPGVPGPGNITIYRIESIARFGGTPDSPDYAERTRTAIFSR